MSNKATRITLVSAIAFAVLSMAFTAWLFTKRLSGEYDVSSRGKLIAANYYTYNGNVYVGGSGDGYYILPGADAGTFEVLRSIPFGYSLGKDRNAVYCGDHAIAGLAPDGVRRIEGGYIGGGRQAWFCGHPEENPEYHWWQEITGSHDEHDPQRIKRFYYPLVAMTNVNADSLHMVNRNYGADDTHLFYKGRVIENSDAASAQRLLYGKGWAEGHEDLEHIKDRRAVYFKGPPLAGASPAAFSVFVPYDGSYKDAYGFDAATGDYYFQGEKFPATADNVDARSLRVLLADQAHAYHELFINDHGIFFRDLHQGELRLACATPPANLRPAESMRSAFTDGQSLYITAAIEEWSQGRGGRRLTSRNTAIYKVRDVSIAQLQRVETLAGKAGAEAELWRDNKGQLFFEPRFTRGNFYDDSLYRVTDEQRLKETLASGEKYHTRKQLQSAMSPIRDELVCEAVTDYRSTFGRYGFVFILGLIALGPIAAFIGKKRKKTEAPEGAAKNQVLGRAKKADSAKKPTSPKARMH